MTDGLQEDAVVREQAHLKNLEEAISALGAAILELKMNTGGTDSEKQLSELEARYSNLKSEFEAFEAAEREAGIPVGEPPRDAEGRIIPRLAA